MKKAFKVFAILTGVFFLGFVGCLLGLCAMSGNFGNTFVSLMKIFGQGWTHFVEFFTNFQAANWWGIISLLACVLFVVFAIVWAIVCGRKHKGKFAWFIVLFLVGLLAPIFTFSCFPGSPVFAIFWNPAISSAAPVGERVLDWCIIICSGLALIFTVLTFAFGLAAFEEKVVAPVEMAAIAAPEEQPIFSESLAESVAEPVIETPVEPVVPAIEPEPEPIPVFAPGQEAVEEPVSEKKEEKPEAFDIEALKASLKEAVRDIVREEIARNELTRPGTSAPGNSTITGATFGGPLVVQYFNGWGGPAPVPPAPAPQPQPGPQQIQQVEQHVAVAPAPKAEEKKPAFGAKKEAPKAEPKPVVAPVEAPAEDKKVYERISFEERLLKSEKDVQDIYNELKNEILSYGVKSRISNSGDTFRLHTKTYVKMTVAGKSIKLYLALDPRDYKDSTIPFDDASGKGLYTEIPFVFKVKSALSIKRAKQLINETCAKDGLVQGEVENINWIKEIKASKK